MLPALFVGHGSPMNALGGNAFSAWLNQLGRDLPKPRAILCISAHWESVGTQVLDVASPPTIHDFFGFPPELYRLRYPAPGATALAGRVVECLGGAVQRSQAWGFDHGAWSVLHHLYPQADIPVTQLSLNSQLSLAQHFALARGLRSLREEGVLILGSGNIVHNLREISWNSGAPIMPWAADFDAQIAQALAARDLEVLLQFKGVDPALVKRAVPTVEHYLPLLYVLAVSDSAEKLSFPFTEIQNGSISMRAVSFTS